MQTNTKKPNLYLFTDGSANPQKKFGFGAYLLLNEDELHSITLSKEDVFTKKFEDTSSSKLELEALLWALNKISVKERKVIIFTDCQNIIGLYDRRKKFEKNNYMTSKKTLIKNYELYKEFYRLTDNIECDFVKVKGHKKDKDKNMIDKIFTLVDKAARDALREEVL
ncbi:MAG: ribonuclease H [Sulfurimonas sp.]|uniref:RNase H family protein n=1 Tax=Sulfurimonas sp. TaxID=2022749 RepID=UPI0025DA98F3|nr:RNase H family protein [Sulfurimonas sp.]MCK9491237.1 ribonuclease H [Sulfurimonas sp.]